MVFKVNKYKNQMPGGVTPKTKMEANTKVIQKFVRIYQITTKGEMRLIALGYDFKDACELLWNGLSTQLKFGRKIYKISKGLPIYIEGMEAKGAKGLRGHAHHIAIVPAKWELAEAIEIVGTYIGK